MRRVIIFVFLFSFNSCKSQSRAMPPPPPILTGTEIQLMNFSGSTVSFRISEDKKNWTIDSVKQASQISRKASTLYVELCQDITNTTICDTFQLEHENRYVIDLDDSKTKLVIKRTKAL
jgi:hypothetical protein